MATYSKGSLSYESEKIQYNTGNIVFGNTTAWITLATNGSRTKSLLQVLLARLIAAGGTGEQVAVQFKVQAHQPDLNTWHDVYTPNFGAALTFSSVGETKQMPFEFGSGDWRTEHIGKLQLAPNERIQWRFANLGSNSGTFLITVQLEKETGI